MSRLRLTSREVGVQDLDEVPKRVTGTEVATEIGCLAIAAMVVNALGFGPFPDTGTLLISATIYALGILTLLYGAPLLVLVLIRRVRKSGSIAGDHRNAIIFAFVLLALLAFGKWYGGLSAAP